MQAQQWAETERYLKGFEDGRKLEREAVTTHIKALEYSLDRAQMWELILALALIIALALGGLAWKMRTRRATEGGAGSPPAAPLSWTLTAKGNVHAV